MLLFLSILFWALVLVAAPVAAIRLLLALRGKRIGDTPYCRLCNYNRLGIHPDSPCPECGCGTCDMYGWPNVVTGKMTRTLGMFLRRLTIAALAIAAAWGVDHLRYTCKILPGTITLAVDHGDYDKVQKWVKWFPELADGTFRFGRDQCLIAPLGVAAQNNDKKMVEILLNAGANPNGADPLHHAQTPLYSAAGSNGNLIITQLILEAGADPNMEGIPWNGTPLWRSCGENNPEIVAMLLEHGADPNLATMWGTPAARVISHSHHAIAMLSLLLEAGADPDILADPTDPRGASALHLSIEKERSDLISLLLDHGADVNLLSSEGMTPLDYAIRRDNYQSTAQTQAVLELLRAQGAMTSEELDAQAEHEKPEAE